MAARGYVPTGPGVEPGALQGLRLGLANKAAIWRMGMARYGTALYFSEKLARRLGLTGLHRWLRVRTERKALRYLK